MSIIKELREQYKYDPKRHDLFEGYSKSIKTLAEDLYSKQFHFLFEIIQNADDNEYAENVSPILELELCKVNVDNQEKVAIVIRNNETGFTDDNVKAICKIGSSTKAQSFDSIGEKGIGFKSVYRVTDCPYIYSNDIAFKLPEKPLEEYGLGYIVPYEIPSVKRKYNTEILLPIKKEFKVEDACDGLKKLSDFTILFLRKLKMLSIVINLDNQQYRKVIERKDEGDYRTLKISDSNQQEKIYKFLLQSKEVAKPNEINHSKRKGVKSRNISVAIPISEHIPQCVLFSYLPVWDIQLPFMVNSDFLLTSDRENLHLDGDGGEWNEWLRKEAVSVYIDGFKKLIQLENLPNEDLIYNSIPIKTDKEFIDPIVNGILENVKKIPFLKAYNVEKKYKPNQLKKANEDLCTLIENNQTKPQCLEKDFPILFTSNLNTLSKQVLIEVGVEDVVLKNFEDYFLSDDKWIAGTDDDWLCQLYEYLRTNKFKNSKRRFKIILLEDGKMNTSKDVYFDTDSDLINSIPEEISRFIDVKRINTNFLQQYLKQDKLNKLFWLNRTLGIKDFNQTVLIEQLFQIVNDDSLHPDLLINATNYLYEINDKNLEECNMVVLSNKAIRELWWEDVYDYEEEEKQVVVPINYRPEDGWQHIFIDGDREHFDIISDKYSKEVIEYLVKKHRLALYPFFYKRPFDVYDPPETYEGDTLDERLEDLSASIHSHKREGLEHLKPQSFDNPTKELSKSLVSYLDIYLNLNYEENHTFFLSGINNRGVYHNHGSFYRYEYSIIYTYLTTEPWLYTGERFGYQVPSSVFLNTQGIKEIMKGHVPYYNFSKNESVLRLLKINKSLSTDYLQNYLFSLINNGTNINFNALKNIYREMDRRGDEFFFSSLLESDEYIYIDNGDEWKWTSNDKCIWEGNENLDFDGYILANIYPQDLKKFFVEKLKVSESISELTLLKKWLVYQDDFNNFNTIAFDYILRQIKRNYEHLFSCYDFLQRAKVYCHDGFYDTDQVYFSDDNSLKRIFKDDNSFKFAYIPKGDGSEPWVDFYKQFNLRFLSENIKITIDENSCNFHQIENRFFTESAIKLIGAYLKTYHEEFYTNALRNGIFDKIISIKELESQEVINVQYGLENYEGNEKTIEKEQNVHLDLDKNKIYYFNPEKYLIAHALYTTLKKIGCPLKTSAKNSFEVYLSESNLKRRERDNLNTPKELYGLMKELPLKDNDTIILDQQIEEIPNTINEENKSIKDKEVESSHEAVGSINEGISPFDEQKDDTIERKDPIEEIKDDKDLDNTQEIENSYHKPRERKRNSPKRDEDKKTNQSTEDSFVKDKNKLDKDIEKIEREKETLSQKKALYNHLSQSEKYSYDWLLTLTELEYLEDIEKSTANKYSIAFNAVKQEGDVLYLDFPNKYVSTQLEQYENLSLVLYTHTKTTTVSIQTISVNKYTVRAKLWKIEDVDSLNFDHVEKALLKIDAVDFLWKTLLDQLNDIKSERSITNANLLHLVKQNKNISFIFGPPGTGKTTTIVNEYLIPNLDKKKTLVLTPTNKSADVIAERLIQTDGLSGYYRFGNTGSDEVEKHSSYIAKCLPNNGNNVVVTTIARFAYDIISFESADGSGKSIRNNDWDMIVIDEASMINLSQIIGVVLSSPVTTEILIVGDPFQIQPILNVSNWEGENIYSLVGLSSFELEELEGFGLHKLMKQYRSVPEIGNLYSQYCYGGALENERESNGLNKKYKLSPGTKLSSINVIKFPVKKDNTLFESKYLNKSSYHIYLGLFIIEWLKQFTANIEPKTIGIISPYRAQSDLLYKLVNANYDHFKEHKILVSTVHGFQGDECDIIVCAFNPPKSVKSKSIINNKNVLNVSISRAKDYLVLFVPENYNSFNELKEILDFTKNVDKGRNSISTKILEEDMFQEERYIAKNTFATSHHSINVFGNSQYLYEVKVEENALDIQINQSAKQEEDPEKKNKRKRRRR